VPASHRDIVATPRAQRDLIEIWLYFADVASPDLADRLLLDIDRAARRLVEYPRLGRPRDDVLAGLRSVIVPPYAILYRVTEENVEISRILHTRRDLAAAFIDDI